MRVVARLRPRDDGAEAANSTPFTFTDEAVYTFDAGLRHALRTPAAGPESVYLALAILSGPSAAERRCFQRTALPSLTHPPTDGENGCVRSAISPF